MTARQPLIDKAEPWGAIRAALAQAQKSNRNAPAYSRWVNRPVGRVFAATAYKLGMTPNQVTAVSAVFTFAGIGVLATGTPSWGLGVLVAVLLVLGYALDSADGQLARLRGGGSPAGEWLDHVIDSVKMGTFHLAVAILWFRNLGDLPVLTTLVPLVFAAQASVFFFGIIITDLVMRAAGTKKAVLAHEESTPSTIMSLVGIPADYGFLAVSMVLLGWFEVWRGLYALLAALNLVILAIQLVRWYRRIEAAG
jgi:phosphatidylglycerophosphate synthase